MNITVEWTACRLIIAVFMLLCSMHVVDNYGALSLSSFLSSMKTVNDAGAPSFFSLVTVETTL